MVGISGCDVWSNQITSQVESLNNWLHCKRILHVAIHDVRNLEAVGLPGDSEEINAIPRIDLKWIAGNWRKVRICEHNREIRSSSIVPQILEMHASSLRCGSVGTEDLFHYP